uniref:Cilia- and flagella-associated protein 45 n=1 Tax=Lygus hesperus TaxID=30085 RepID=A0A0A9Z1T8_LYGHE
MLEAEEQQRLTYWAAREAKEQAQAAEQRQRQITREKEIAAIRASQERAQDRRAELDELRAQRIQGAFVREENRKTHAAAQRERKLQAELNDARKAQIIEKR